MLKPITRELVTVAGEWLKTLVLLQSLSKPSECQKGLMNLLLEAILFVFCASENDFSQELIDIRSTAVRLVSLLAQIPSSAIHFKDILLAMPMTHREQLLVIIRTSVTQDQIETQKKSTTPSLTIKLPMQTEKNTHEISSPSPTAHTDKNRIDEEEDDWDSFQSFPASTNPATIESEGENAPEEPTSAKNSSVSDANTKYGYFQEYSSSLPSNGMKEIDVEHQLAVEEQVLNESVGGTIEIRELSDFQSSSHSDVVLRDNHNEDRDGGALASQVDGHQVSTDLHPVDDDERLDEVKLVHIGQIEEIPADTSDLQAPSDPLSLEVPSESAGFTNEINEFSDSQSSHSYMESCNNHREDRDDGAAVSHHLVSTTC